MCLQSAHLSFEEGEYASGVFAWTEPDGLADW